MGNPAAPTLDELGAQYREARDSIAPHRRRQAAAEVELGRLQRSRHATDEDLDAARERVARAVADVRWCQAVTVAAGEAFKGVAFEDVPRDRSLVDEQRTRALAALEDES